MGWELLLEVLAIGEGFMDAEVSFGADVVVGADGRWGWARREYEDVRNEEGKLMGTRHVSSALPLWFASYRELDAYIWGFDYAE